MRCMFSDLAYAKVEARLYADIHKISLTEARNRFAVLCGYRNWKDLVHSPLGLDGSWEADSKDVHPDFKLLSLYGPASRSIREDMFDHLFIHDDIRSTLISLRRHLAFGCADEIVDIYVMGDESLKKKFETLATDYMSYHKNHNQKSNDIDNPKMGAVVVGGPIQNYTANQISIPWLQGVIQAKTYVVGQTVEESQTPIIYDKDSVDKTIPRHNGLLLSFYGEEDRKVIFEKSAFLSSLRTSLDLEEKVWTRHNIVSPMNPQLFLIFANTIRTKADLIEVKRLQDAIDSGIFTEKVYFLPPHLFPEHVKFDFYEVNKNGLMVAMSGSHDIKDFGALLRSDPDIILTRTTPQEKEYNSIIRKGILTGHSIILCNDPFDITEDHLLPHKLIPVEGWPKLFHIS